MKKILLFLLSLCLLCSLLPASLADDAGVLTESELIQWIDQLLLSTRDLSPLNAPVGEEARTEDGYAFLYDFATLYYDKPELDASSVLQAVSITSDSFPAPRDLRLGSSEDALISAFGWQNPYLMGDGSFAAFYRTDELPRAAYWSWAQHDDEWHMTSAQCAVHISTGSEQYTDAGISFELENRLISAIRIYGLNRLISLSDVQANLDAVASVEAASGAYALDEHFLEQYIIENSDPIFNEADLFFSGMDFRTLTIAQVERALGCEAVLETTDDGNGPVTTASWDGVYLSASEAGVDVLSVSKLRLAGPRAVCTGDDPLSALCQFASDGLARTHGHQILLYGDGVNVPYGVMERSGSSIILSYAAQMHRGDEMVNVTLRMQFMDDAMTEWMIYTW